VGNGERVAGLSPLASLSVFLRDFGFPAAVAAFVLWRVDGHVVDLVTEAARTNELLRRCIVQRADAVAPLGGHLRELGAVGGRVVVDQVLGLAPRVVARDGRGPCRVPFRCLELPSGPWRPH
jgi:hypothetical protein